MLKYWLMSLILLVPGTLINVYIITQGGSLPLSSIVLMVLVWAWFFTGLFKIHYRQREKDGIFDNEGNRDEIELYHTEVFIEEEN